MLRTYVPSIPRLTYLGVSILLCILLSVYQQLNMSSKLCTTMKTYGPRPKSFTLVEGGDEYFLGSEIGNYLRLFRGDLYKRYPGLWKRKMTQEERKHASEQIGYGHNNVSTNVQIVKVSEVEDILTSNDDKYRSSFGFDTVVSSSANVDRTPSVQHSNSGSTTRGSKKSPWIATIPGSSYHLDAVPCATTIARYKTNTKKIKSFPTW